jgi:hypothetical protein
MRYFVSEIGQYRFGIFDSEKRDKLLFVLNDGHNASIIADALERDKKFDYLHIHGMKYEEAKLILHPDTTLIALADIEYYAGFDREKLSWKK